MYAVGTVPMSSLAATLTSAITYTPGEIAPSAEFSATLGGSQSAVQIALPAFSGGITPSGWRIYKGSSSGNEQYLTTIPGNASVFIDDGSIVTGTTSAPTTAIGSIAGLPGSVTTSPSASAITNFLDQQFTSTSSQFHCSYDQFCSQGFFPNYSKLSSIALALDVNGSPAGNVNVYIYPATYNNPTANTIHNVPQTSGTTTPLASASVAISAISHFSTSGLYTQFNFASAVTVVPGNLYHIVVHIDSTAATLASGNYLLINGISTTTAVCPGINTVMTASTLAASWALYTASANTSMAYKINATGVLSTGTNYYVVTAVTGFVPVKNLTYNASTTATYTAQVMYSAGALSLDNLYVAIGKNNSTNNSVQLILLETFDTNYNAIANYALTQYSDAGSNGFPLAGSTTEYYNSRYDTVYAYTSTTTNTSTVNATYRLHFFLDHIFLDLTGDPSLTGYYEDTGFIGKATSVLSTDKHYVVSGLFSASNYGIEMAQLRDASNAAGTYPNSLFLIPSIGNGTGTQDAFAYLNSFTNNYDGITLALADKTGGYRSTIPHMILFPSSIKNVIQNHDTFNVNGQTYELYIPNSAKWFFYGSTSFISQFYPAVQTS